MSKPVDLQTRTPVDAVPSSDPVVSVLRDVTLTLHRLWVVAAAGGDETRAFRLLIASRALHEALEALSP